jgi:hypothetical protein
VLLDLFINKCGSKEGMYLGRKSIKMLDFDFYL